MQIDLQDLADQVTIPTLPEVVTRLNTMVEDPKIGLDEIGEVVAQDAAISSKVLRIANSAVYGLAEPAKSVTDAARVVGARTLRNIALQASVFAHYDKFASCEEFDLYSIWRHAIFTGQLSQELSVRSPEIRDMPPDEFYTCGLLHDIGKMVLLESLGEAYLDIWREARTTGRGIHLVEADLLGFNHTDVGAVVAQRWDLHEHIGNVIRLHHGPRIEIEDDPHSMVVAVADQLAYRLETASFERFARKMAALASQFLRLSPAEFQELVEWGTEIYPLIEV